APGPGAEHAQERGRVRGARADLGVVGLHDRAALLLPVGLERREHALEGVRHRGPQAIRRGRIAGPDQACSVRMRKPPWWAYVDSTTRTASAAVAGSSGPATSGRSIKASIVSRLPWRSRNHSGPPEHSSHTAPPAAAE